MSDHDHDEAPATAAPTESPAHHPPSEHPEVHDEIAPRPGPSFAAAVAARAPLADAAPPAASPPAAPAAPPPEPPRKALEDWARQKGMHPLVPKTVKGRRTGKVTTKLVPNPNPEKHFYAGALAKWQWIPSMEVTEAEFDAEVLRAAHGVVVGSWPHPRAVTASVAAAFAALLASGGEAPRPRLAALPDVTTTIEDNGLGIAVPSSGTSCAVIGSCAGGTVNTVYGFNDPATLVSTLVGGPAVELAAYMLNQPGHGTVYVTPCNCSTAGACGATTYARVTSPTTSVGTIVASGAAFDAFAFVVTIVTGAASVAGGGGVFTYSADGGNTVSPLTAIPTGGAYVVPGTNVTITFAGTTNSFNAGDVATFSTTAPYYSGSDFTTAFNALAANPAVWRFVYAAGAASSATNAATFASTFQSLMNGLYATDDAFAYGAMQCNDTDANCISAFANFAGNRVAVAAGQAWIVSPISGRTYTRDGGWAAFARIATRPVSEDAGRVATGALSGVTKLLRNEQLTPGLDAARFITLRTIIGKQGFYITDGWTMAPAGSDFQLLEYRQIMDVACTAARAAELNFLNDTLRVNPAGVSAPLVAGAIDPRDANYIATEVNSEVRTALSIGVASGGPGDASASQVLVNQSTDILESETIPISVRVTPNGVGKFIANDMGLNNPGYVPA